MDAQVLAIDSKLAVWLELAVSLELIIFLRESQLVFVRH